ncbi:MAG: WD40 repeat domain-containing protein, partial [Verrucomicrobiota bacterium]|nr:WD40 repeat domain-containing protein [Verrucomicrobiota bacterium]
RSEVDIGVQRLGDLRGVWQANLNHDGSRVIVRMRGGEVGLWDVAEGTAIAGDLGLKTPSESYVMSPDARMVLVGFKQAARVFDASSGTAVSPIFDVQLHDHWQPQAVFSPDGEVVILFEKKEALVFNVKNGAPITTIPIPSNSDEDTTDSSAAAIFTAGGANCFIMDRAGAVTQYDAKSWKPVGKRMRHPPADAAYEFGFTASDDAKWVVTFDRPGENGPKGRLQVWDAGSSRPVGEPIVAVNGLVGRFLPGTNRILITPGRGEASVRDLPSMHNAYIIRPHDDVDAPSVEVSIDGKWIISWGGDRAIRLLDAETGKLANHYSSPAAVVKVIIAPDSSACYVVVDNTAFLLQEYHDSYIMKLSLPDLKITHSIRILDYLVRTSLSPDGSRLMIQQWKTGRERVRFFDAATLTLIEAPKS